MASPMNPDYFNVVQMNVPRTELVYGQWQASARRLGDARLGALVDFGFEGSAEVALLARQRRTQTDSRTEDGEDEFDVRMDDACRPLIKGIRDAHEYMKRTRHSLRARVGQLVNTHFPVGPGDIISQRYEEQLHRVQAFIADMRGPYADLIDELECERKLRRVEALVPEYIEALAARRRISAKQVRLAAQEMHRRTLIILAHILATHHDAPDALAELLLPFDDQQARIRAILKARRTGQPVGDDPSRDDDDFADVDDIDRMPEGEADAGADAPDADDVDAPAADADPPAAPEPPRPVLAPLPNRGSGSEGGEGSEGAPS